MLSSTHEPEVSPLQTGYRYLAFGSNVCHQLGPAAGQGIIKKPTDITSTIGQIDKMVWHNWTCTIVQDSSGDWRGWGMHPLVSMLVEAEGSSSSKYADSAPVKVIGFDEPIAFLQQDGHVTSFDGQTRSLTAWDDVAITGLNEVYAFRQNHGLYHYESLSDFFSENETVGLLDHPLLSKSSHLKLFAAESRVLVFHKGQMSHAFEVLDTRGLPPGSRNSNTAPRSLQLLEDLEGLGVDKIVSGSGNRFAALTEAGQVYLLAPKSEKELLDFGDQDVKLVGIGSDFEVAITDTKIYVRGSNNFGQLGIPEHESMDTFAELELEAVKAEQIVDIHISRWSTILCIKGS